MPESIAVGALSRFGHALSDLTRTQVLLELVEGPAYPSDLATATGVSRQVMSNHLSCLRGCGLVVAVPEGRRLRYELVDQRIAHALRNLLGVVLVADPACSCGQGDADCSCGGGDMLHPRDEEVVSDKVEETEATGVAS